MMPMVVKANRKNTAPRIQMRRFLQYLSDSLNVPSTPMSPVAPGGILYTRANIRNATAHTPAMAKNTAW